MDQRRDRSLTCPIPISEYPSVLLAHGGGGRLMHQLVEKMFVSTFANPLISQRHDSALLHLEGIQLAFTTDSFVVHPLFFPGGDIGALAVNGTVNDLAMSGARPLFLSAGFILEEGVSMETLWRVVRSMRHAAEDAAVQIVTGDTKVVERGKADGVFINTSGVGIIEHDLSISPASVRPGDVIVLNGDIGRHGMAIMAVREGLEFEGTIESDCAPIAGLVAELLDVHVQIHCLRDLTRGGLASALIEIAKAAGVQIHIDERAIPVRDDVRGACEILGLDPLYVANEGRFVASVSPSDAERALSIMRSHPYGSGASIIGHVARQASGAVKLKTKIGASRLVEMLSGEQLPRIC